MAKPTISPSKLERAVLCPGSANATKDIPWKDTPASLRGRALHDAMALLFQAGDQAWPSVREAIASNKYCDPSKDVKQVEEALEWGRGLLPADDNAKILIEQGVDVEWMGLGGGRVDAMFISPKYSQAVLIDWKFGSGPVPDPATNWQMRAYGCGLLTSQKALDLQAVEPAIIQPGAYKKDDAVRSHVWSKEELRGFGAEIKKMVALAKTPGAPLIAGPHCRGTFCDARETCPAFKAYEEGRAHEKVVVEQAKVATITTMGTPVEITPAEPMAFPMVVINAETVVRAQEMRERLLSMRVTDEHSANVLGNSAKEARNLINLIEKNREAVKKPVLDLGRAIDAAAKQATQPLNEAAAHADDQVRAWVQEQKAIADKARAEEERKQAEAQAKERAKAEEAAAKGRAAQEAEARAATLKTKAAREKAEAEAAKLRAEAEAAERQRKEAEQAQIQAQAAATAVEGPAKVAGFRNTVVVTWEIPDLSAVPKELQGVILMPNAKVIDTMIKTGVLNEAKHSAWLTIALTADVARSR